MARDHVKSAYQKSVKSEGTAISRSQPPAVVPVKPGEKAKKLTGLQKVAILMVALGSDVAADILKELSEQEVQAISKEISQLNKISAEDKDKVLKDFEELFNKKQFITMGGADAAKAILARAFGDSKAQEIVSGIEKGIRKKPFDFLNDFEPEDIVLLLREEHPQTIALTLSYMKPALASKVISALPDELRAPIAKRIATMDRSNPEVITEVEKVLEDKLARISSEKIQRVDGVNTLAEILNNLDKDSEQKILDSIEEENDELAGEIRNKMFMFENIVILSDREVQKLLDFVEKDTLAMALKGEEQELREKLLSNVSKNKRLEILDEMKLIGPVRYRDVHEAQQKILNVLKIMEAQGEVYLKDRDSENYMV